VRSAILALVLAACGGAVAPAAGDEPHDVARLALTGAPPDVGCVRIVVTGATRSVERDLDVAASVTVDGLPTGTVLIAGDAFGVSCDHLAGAAVTWSARPVETTLSNDLVTSIALVFERR
jgi:hypothetical protein